MKAPGERPGCGAQATWRSNRGNAPIPHRRFDISFQRRGMAADAAVSLAGWNWSSCPTTAIQFRVDSALTAAPILTTQAYGPAKPVNWARRRLGILGLPARRQHAD